ncbi:hypothetical protein PAUR_a0160 [Pseudoalteromonas aurantia 208]|uniref:Orphan protein n=1 Tax=Pseudoalteromonas aurantia 208 TaxID=1314867 RepID=A0ABR9E7C1_9GAMM|nr:hypothetical protein [Pseudoalteromonas aurantia 208]
MCLACSTVLEVISFLHFISVPVVYEQQVLPHIEVGLIQ